jgi:serine/threonine-protein kinase
VDRATFLENLHQSRLLPEEQLAGFVAALPAQAAPAEVAHALLERGLLTKYQVKQVWEGQGKGLVLGQYRVLNELGRGGFGRVLKAVHAMMGRVVALKVINPELVEDSQVRTWFRREVLASTQLGHANIVMAYDAGEIDDTLFLVMEYVDGQNLDAWVRGRGPLPVALACEVTRQAAQALQHAHEKGMVHRDIKPANLLLAEEHDGTVLVKVADFGLARLHRSAPHGTLMPRHEKGFLGTPDFVSPEQARDLHAVDIRSDLYSLGCTLYFALTARRPFRGKTVLETIVQHLEKDPEPIEAVRPDVPPALRGVLRRMMAKEPGDRFQTPAELIAALAPLCAARPHAAAAVAVGAAAAGVVPENPTAMAPNLVFWEGPRTDAPSDVLPPPSGEPPSGQAPPASESAEMPATACVPLRRPDVSDPTPLPTRARPPVPEPPPEPDEPLPPPSAFRPGPALRRLWGQWFAVVQAVAAGRGARVNEAAYRELRADLLREAQPELGNARPVLLDRLEALVEPWLRAQTLIHLDADALANLLERCRALDEELRGPARLGPVKAVAVLAVLAVVAVLGWFLAQQPQTEATVAQATGWFCAAFAQRPLWFLGGAAAVATLGALGLLSRLRRP